MNPLQHFLDKGVISETVGHDIQTHMEEQGVSFEAAALEAGVSVDVLREKLAEYYGVPSHTPNPNVKIPYEVLSHVPEDSAKHYRIIPLQVEDSVLVVGANNPDDLQIREVLNFVTTKHNLTYRLVFLLEQDFPRKFLS